MTFRRGAAFLLGFSLVALFAPAYAGDEDGSVAAIVVAALELPGPLHLADGLGLPPPDLPIAVWIPGPREAVVARPDPVRTGGIVEVLVPEPPAASAVVSTADAVQGAIQLRLADIRTVGWPQRLPKKDREAVLVFYAARAGSPVWVGTGGWTGAARSLLERLSKADEDGLDPADYPVPAIIPTVGPAAPGELAEAELKLSALASLYARDARGGRIDPARLSALLTPKLDLPPAAAVLAALAGAADRGAALAGYNPAHPGYRALRAKLADLRLNRPTLSVPMARRSIGPELTTQTIAILDDAPLLRPASPYANPRLEGDLVANMERWRWLPAELGERYVAVNVPEFRLRLFDGGRLAHETRVITGRPETPTPIFSGLMEYAIVNPSWHVPPSILKKEFLPKMAADPDYAARQGYEVVRRGSSISIRQPPGERNALGFIKFMFPNQHSVYLHDTPNRNLFSASRRAFSHGCVRVEQPFVLADFVLGEAWSESRLKKLIGRGERTIWLPQKLPVHLTYFTLSVDEAGEVRSFDDLYGHNRRVRAALGLGA